MYTRANNSASNVAECFSRNVLSIESLLHRASSETLCPGNFSRAKTTVSIALLDSVFLPHLCNSKFKNPISKGAL